MEANLDLLYPPVKEITLATIDLCQKNGIDVYPHCTRRTVEDQKHIYGKERWTLHYLGLAIDLYPVLHVPARLWQAAFNAWPHWDLVQCRLAVGAGFDTPAQWQLDRDRPHLQTLCGCNERILRQMWYDSGGNIAGGDITAIWRYMDQH